METELQTPTTPTYNPLHGYFRFRHQALYSLTQQNNSHLHLTDNIHRLWNQLTPEQRLIYTILPSQAESTQPPETKQSLF
jgi:hypothetical protein